MDSRPRKRRDRSRRGRGRGHGRRHTPDRGARYNDGGSTQRRGGGRSGRGKRNQPLGIDVLEEMAKCEPRETLHRLSAVKNHLQRTLQEQDPHFEWMVHLVTAMSNACECDTSEETLVEILSILQSRGSVTGHLMQFIEECQMSNLAMVYPSHVDMLPTLLCSVVTILNSLLSNVPRSVYDVDEAIQCLEFSMQTTNSLYELPCEIINAVEDLYDLSDDVMAEVDQWGLNDPRRDEYELGPEDYFRDLPVFPMVEELQNDHEPFLRANIVDRGYDSVEHYLDVQFRLLREDLVAPLRQGITEFRALRRSNRKHMKLQDVYVYHDVRVLEAKPEHDGIVYVTRFNVKLLSKVQWERSKRLISGSLVCLSTDNFMTVTFAVVNNSDRRGLSRGLVELRFHHEADTTQLISATFTMVESTAYFEAYRHVLKRLQSITHSNFPLQRYIVDTSRYIHLPEYLRQNRNALYDLQPIAKPNGAHYTRAARLEKWPTFDHFDLDPSQYEAYKSALTEELCCIQGPPGTGKTFIGLKIVETLLLNKLAWSPTDENYPILLICFTNHALDQFLEGVLEFSPEGIIRIGGRSSSEKLKDFNLKEIRNRRARLKQRPKHQYLQRKRIREEMLRLANSMRPLQRDIRLANSKVLFDSKLRSVIPTFQWKCLLDGIPEERRVSAGDQCIAHWLGVLDTGSEPQAKKRQMGNGSEAHKDSAPLLVVIRDDSAGGKMQRQDVLEGFGLQKYILNGLNAVGQMSEMEHQRSSDVWHLNLTDRWRLYNHWVSKHQKHLQELLELASGGVLQSHALQEYMSCDHRTSLANYRLRNRLETRELMTSFLGVCGRDIQFPLSTQLQQLTMEDFANKDDVVRVIVGNMRYQELSEIPREMVPRVFRCLSQIQAMDHDEAQRVTEVSNLSNGSRRRLYKYWVDLWSAGIQERLDVSRRNVLRVAVLRPYMTSLQLRNLYDETSTGHIDKVDGEQQFSLWLKAFTGVSRVDVRCILQIQDEDDKIKVKGEAQLMEEKRYLDDRIDEELDEVLHALTTEEEDDKEMTDAQQDPVSGAPYLDRGGDRSTRKHDWTRLHSVDDMPEGRARSVKNVWSLADKDRWMLYRYWVRLFKQNTQAKLRPFNDQYEKQARLLKEARLDEDFDIIRSASVLALTTTGAAKYHDLIRLVHPRIVVVEEAAEVLEAHIVTSLTESCQHLILIGDHQQLRPNPTVYRLARECDLDISLFERLVKNHFPRHRLTLQHRMRPEISVLLKVHEDFYPDLIDAASVKKYAAVRGVTTNVYFLTHSHAELAENESHSKSNEFEAAFIARLCQYFLHQEYLPQQITILTAYSGQLWQLRKHMPNDIFQDIHVCPVDSYQGEENDIILISFVRSNERGNIGFLKTANRVCVALSRAREGLYCVGNFSLLSSQTELWKAITDRLRRSGQIGSSMTLRCSNHPEVYTAVRSVSDFMKVPEGGCTIPCEAKLKCGHICPMVCHPRNSEHVGIICKKECTKSLCNLKHRCRKLCYEKCDEKCNYVVRVRLSCGHKKDIKCYERCSGDVQCQESCTRTLRCGHLCVGKCCDPCTALCEVMVSCTYECGHRHDKKCWEKAELKKCTVEVPQKLPCGHTKWIQCSRKSSTTTHCYELCSKELQCGHPCRKRCWQSCTEKCSTMNTFSFPCGHSYGKPCYEGIDDTCKLGIEITLLCGHRKKVPCHQRARDEECDNPCPKRLACGHQCTGKCGKPCKMCKMIVERTLSCGHKSNLKCYRDTSDAKCDKPCPKILKCGHRCQGKCGESCTVVCMQPGSPTALCEHLQNEYCFLIFGQKCRRVINERLPCGHRQTLQCHEKASTANSLCKEQCLKLLKCGHSCKKTCGEPCDCEMVKTKMFPCGHGAKVRCGDTRTECRSPCGKTLKCGHTCTGTCRQCRQGRLHKLCAQPCGKTLICGHTCKSTCAAFCPPCTGLCETSCAHRNCHELCSAACTPCPARCDSACEHTSCSRLCRQQCVRRPCDKPCRKLLQECGHPCIGMCGDTCPRLCRVCNIDRFKSVDAVSRFVQLEDCRHLFEVKGLDRWMEESPVNDKRIQVKVCPTCKAPIRRSARYTSVIKQTRADVEAVIAQLGNGSRQLNTAIVDKRSELLVELAAEDPGAEGSSLLKRLTSHLWHDKVPAFEGPTVRRLIRDLRRQLYSCSSSSTMASLGLRVEMFKRLCELRGETRKIEGRPENAREKLSLARAFEDLLQWLGELDHVSEQSLEDWGDEARRISSIQRLMETRVHLSTSVHGPALGVIMSEIYTILSTQRADKIKRSLVDTRFRLLERSVPALCSRGIETSFSFENVVAGYPACSGGWYKCKYGHYYWCGAAKKGECPECSANNPGRFDRLRSILRK